MKQFTGLMFATLLFILNVSADIPPPPPAEQMRIVLTQNYPDYRYVKTPNLEPLGWRVSPLIHI